MVGILSRLITTMQAPATKSIIVMSVNFCNSEAIQKPPLESYFSYDSIVLIAN